jgi:nucleoid DNA-binding protein
MARITKKSIPTGVNKKNFWPYINAKINRVIHNRHVYSVINIMLEELIKELFNGKKIEIINLGTLSFEEHENKKVFKFKIDPVFRQKIFNYLDFKRTKWEKFEND